VDTNTGTGYEWYQWESLCFFVLLSGIALLVLWRGRDRASVGLTLWAIAFLTGAAFEAVPLDGRVGLGFQEGVMVFYLLARVGFYLLVESTVGIALIPRTRTLWRGGFLLLLGVGIVQALGGPLIFVATGWAELL
jgi:hypothetical protein